MALIEFKDRIVEHQGRKVFTDINTGEVLMMADETLDEGVVYEQGVLGTAANLNKLAQKEYVDAELSEKADSTIVVNLLAGKANVSDMNDALALKANSSDVATQMATKANTTTMNTALNEKASVTAMNSALALKANTSSLAEVAATGSYQSLTNRPNLHAVASSGNYNDLSNKPAIGKAEVGLGNVDNIRQYSATNPPPYPVSSVNGMGGTVTIPTNFIEKTGGTISGSLTVNSTLYCNEIRIG